MKQIPSGSDAKATNFPPIYTELTFLDETCTPTVSINNYQSASKFSLLKSSNGPNANGFEEYIVVPPKDKQKHELLRNITNLKYSTVDSSDSFVTQQIASSSHTTQHLLDRFIYKESEPQESQFGFDTTLASKNSIVEPLPSLDEYSEGEIIFENTSYVQSNEGSSLRKVRPPSSELFDNKPNKKSKRDFFEEPDRLSHVKKQRKEKNPEESMLGKLMEKNCELMEFIKSPENPLKHESFLHYIGDELRKLDDDIAEDSIDLINDIIRDAKKKQRSRARI